MFDSLNQNLSKIDCARKSLSDMSYRCKNQYLSESQIFITRIENFFIEENLELFYCLFDEEKYERVVTLYNDIFSIKDARKYYREQHNTGAKPFTKHANECYLKAQVKISNPLYQFDEQNEYYLHINQIVENGRKKFLKQEQLSVDEENVHNLTIYHESSKLNFGIHQGREVGELIQECPEYIIWCIENLIHFSVNKFILINKNLIEVENYNRALEIALVKNFVYYEWQSDIEEKEWKAERADMSFNYDVQNAESMGRQAIDRMNEESGGFWDDF